jgi:membrane protein DedA with SNARE-associated domain
MISSFFDALLGFASSLGYFGVFLLMAIESSFIPFPSEIVIPPAAYLASKGEMNVFLVVLFGILGSLLGASINYGLARYLGRVLIYELVEHRFAKYLLLNKRKIEHSEKYFLKYGGISTFLGRLVPAVRQLISLPAGFVEMKFSSFIFFTGLGAGIWVSILAALGYYFGENQKVLELYYVEFKYLAILFVLLIISVFLLIRSLKKRRS